MSGGTFVAGDSLVCPGTESRSRIGIGWSFLHGFELQMISTLWQCQSIRRIQNGCCCTHPELYFFLKAERNLALVCCTRTNPLRLGKCESRSRWYRYFVHARAVLDVMRGGQPSAWPFTQLATSHASQEFLLYSSTGVLNTRSASIDWNLPLGRANIVIGNLILGREDPIQLAFDRLLGNVIGAFLVEL